MKIKELAEKPREKALLNGIESLTDTELLSLLIESGSRQASAFELAMSMLAKCQGIAHLSELSLATLMDFPGIKEARALRILAAIELAKRVSFSHEENIIKISSALDICNYFAKSFQFEKQEHFVALYLDVKHQILRKKTLFIGSLDCSIVHPREVFKEALQSSAACLVIVHNHPSGDPTPSIQDQEITTMIADTGKIMQIPLLDHVIIGHKQYFSFREAELL